MRKTVRGQKHPDARAEPILSLTRRDARRIHVGKERDHHVMRREKINRLLADLAKDGHRVLRSKGGGEPFIGGRVVRLREKLHWFRTPEQPNQGAKTTAAV
jgi:siroheme synthase